MVTQIAYTALIALTGLERLFELRVSRRNAEWSFERGGQEFGQGHFPFMVAIHTTLLIGCVAEVWLFDRPFVPWLAGLMFVLAVAAQALRWWVIRTLGRQWNTRVIVVPGMDRVEGGPFRWLRHPNYLAVCVEGFALPLIHGAWITAIWFTLLNAIVLSFRVRSEERALRHLQSSEAR